VIADRQHGDFRHWLAQGKGAVLVDPLGEGFQMGDHPVDGAVRPFFRAVDFYGILQGQEEIATCPGRPGRAQGVAEFLPEKTQEQG